MPTLLLTTTAARDIGRIDEIFSGVASKAHAMAIALNEAWHAFWDLPYHRLLAVLQEWGPAKVQAVFEEHNAAALAINRILDAAGRDNTPQRAITVPGREISFDMATGQWTIAPDAADAAGSEG